MDIIREYIKQLDGLEQALLTKLNYIKKDNMEIHQLFVYQYDNPREIFVNEPLFNTLSNDQKIQELKGLVLRVIQHPVFTIKH